MTIVSIENSHPLLRLPIHERVNGFLGPKDQLSLAFSTAQLWKNCVDGEGFPLVPLQLGREIQMLDSKAHCPASFYSYYNGAKKSDLYLQNRKIREIQKDTISIFLHLPKEKLNKETFFDEKNKRKFLLGAYLTKEEILLFIKILNISSFEEGLSCLVSPRDLEMSYIPFSFPLECWISIARVYFEMGNLDDAKKHFQAIFLSRINSKILNEEIFHLLDLVMMSPSDFRGAHLVQEVLSFALGSIDSRKSLHDKDFFIRCFNLALSVDESSPEFLTNLGRLVRMGGGHFVDEDVFEKLISARERAKTIEYHSFYGDFIVDLCLGLPSFVKVPKNYSRLFKIASKIEDKERKEKTLLYLDKLLPTEAVKEFLTAPSCVIA